MLSPPLRKPLNTCVCHAARAGWSKRVRPSPVAQDTNRAVMGVLVQSDHQAIGARRRDRGRTRVHGQTELLRPPLFQLPFVEGLRLCWLLVGGQESVRSHKSICCRDREGQPADYAVHASAIRKLSAAARRVALQLDTLELCVCLCQGRARTRGVVRVGSRLAPNTWSGTVTDEPIKRANLTMYDRII